MTSFLKSISFLYFLHLFSFMCVIIIFAFLLKLGSLQLMPLKGNLFFSGFSGFIFFDLLGIEQNLMNDFLLFSFSLYLLFFAFFFRLSKFLCILYQIFCLVYLGLVISCLYLETNVLFTCSYFEVCTFTSDDFKSELFFEVASRFEGEVPSYSPLLETCVKNEHNQQVLEDFFELYIKNWKSKDSFAAWGPFIGITHLITAGTATLFPSYSGTMGFVGTGIMSTCILFTRFLRYMKNDNLVRIMQNPFYLITFLLSGQFKQLLLELQAKISKESFVEFMISSFDKLSEGAAIHFLLWMASVPELEYLTPSLLRKFINKFTKTSEDSDLDDEDGLSLMKNMFWKDSAEVFKDKTGFSSDIPSDDSHTNLDDLSSTSSQDVFDTDVPSDFRNLSDDLFTEDDLNKGIESSSDEDIESSLDEIDFDSLKSYAFGPAQQDTELPSWWGENLEDTSSDYSSNDAPHEFFEYEEVSYDEWDNSRLPTENAPYDSGEDSMRIHAEPQEFDRYPYSWGDLERHYFFHPESKPTFSDTHSSSLSDNDTLD